MAVLQLSQRSGSPLVRPSVEGCQRALATSRKCVRCEPFLRSSGPALRRFVAVKAARNDKSGPSSSNDFNLAEYVEAKVELGKNTASVVVFLARAASVPDSPGCACSASYQGVWPRYFSQAHGEQASVSSCLHR